MKSTFVFAFLFLFALLPAQAQTIFQQDVAHIHGVKNGLPDAAITQLTLVDQTPVALAAVQSYIWNGSKWIATEDARPETTIKSPKGLPENAGNILSHAVFLGKEYVGCENGLFVKTGKKTWTQELPYDDNYSWALKNVAALTIDTNGSLWFGAKQGVGRKTNGKWHLFTGKEELPYTHFTCAAAGPNGEVWFGTTNGAIRAEGDYFYYRSNRRWLPDNKVNDIAIASDGTAWIATNKGISQITSKKMTYEDKAAYFTKQVEERHNRMGFICQSKLSEQFNIDSSHLDISDNDGMYTAMYGAAQAFRYAATGDKQAKELANRSLKSCKWLVDITPEAGFPARVIIPIDYPEDVNKQYSHESNLNHQKRDPFWKDIYPRFPKSADGKYRWKCDTSSDELAGHYFFYGIYYDLVAETKEEKAAVKQVVADITDHLIRHDFKLVDYDGKPTRWGNFSPDYVNSIWGWDQRGINSMVLLSFLNVATHVTGNPKYEKVAKELRDKEKYHINAMHSKEFFPPENAVPWDNNISLMSMYGLMNYEKDPELLIMYRMSLENTWLHISKQKNAFWDGLYAALTQSFAKKIDAGYFKTDTLFKENPLFAKSALKTYYTGGFEKKNIIESLQRIPLDLIGYSMKNSHRLDIVTDPTPGHLKNMGWRVDEYALPVDERGHVRQDRDGFVLNESEGNGYAEHEGTFYLLPYYLALKHQLIEP